MKTSFCVAICFVAGLVCMSGASTADSNTTFCTGSQCRTDDEISMLQVSLEASSHSDKMKDDTVREIPELAVTVGGLEDIGDLPQALAERAKEADASDDIELRVNLLDAATDKKRRPPPPPPPPPPPL